MWKKITRKNSDIQDKWQVAKNRKEMRVEWEKNERIEI